MRFDILALIVFMMSCGSQSTQDDTAQSQKELDRKGLGSAWIKSGRKTIDRGEGFILSGDGRAMSINMPLKSYKSWKLDGHDLIIKSSDQNEDTLQVVELTDTHLSVKKGSQELTFVKNDFKEECYLLHKKEFDYPVGGVKLYIVGDLIWGSMFYDDRQTDSSYGKLSNGKWEGDRLFLENRYSSEGESQIAEVVFKREGQDINQGFGEFLEKNGVWTIVREKPVTFDQKYIRSDCSEPN